MSKGKIIGIVILAIVLLIGLDFGFGYLGVFKTRTVGKAIQNAERVVYEQTQSYVHAKKQEALKAYKEYIKASPEEKIILKNLAAQQFAEFDENKLTGEVYNFIYMCKYE